MIDNPYSKFRYSNNFSLKFKADAGSTNTYGSELRAFSSHIKAQVGDPWVNNGATWVTDNVFRGNQITKVDQPVVNDPNAPKRVFFRLFKL